MPPSDGFGPTVEDVRKGLIENRREHERSSVQAVLLETIASYLHNGRIGVMVE
jgi:hypothetical protein